jgi:iron complex outermembrane recepter protein
MHVLKASRPVITLKENVMAFFSPSIRLSARPAGFRPSHIASAAATSIALLSATGLSAQTVPEITITDTAPSQVSGFGDVPLSKAPFSAVSFDRQTLQDIGAQRVSDALRLDASVSDSYNSPAYWDMLSVRGYTLDNRYNYRREGMPISAETMIPMDNKERIELFKGTSGIQAGTSAPGGLVNYVVKRPPSAKDETIRSVSVSYGPGHGSSTSLDLGGRFGQDQALGYRLNVAYEDLDPYIKNTEGHRKLFALAMDWRITPDSKLEWEIERSERQQFGVNGYSLLGNTLPAPVDGTHNLTRQNWSVPGVFQGTTGSIRFKQNLESGWLWTTQYGGQRLKTDDNLTYGFGYNCYGILDSSDGATKLCDRYRTDGVFELDDYRSHNEKRLVDALKTEVSGQTTVANVQHNISVGLLRYRQLDRLPPMQAWNTAGWANLSGDSSSQAQPTPSFPNTNKSEYNTELSLRDRIQLSPETSVWIGARHTQYARSSERNASCDLITYECVAAPHTDLNKSEGNITTPWIGAQHQINDHQLYASYGEGVELSAVPNTILFTNAGQLLAVAKSRQIEFGVRSQIPTHGFAWSATAFAITKPLAYDIWDANSSTFTRYQDGQQKHTGMDLNASWRNTSWLLQGQAQIVKARISDVEEHPEIGTRPLNVPKYTLRALAEYRFANVPGLRTSLRVSHEGERRVLEDGSINLPGWTTTDLAAHYDTRIDGTRTQWTLAIDNVADRHYWRESPKQFGHYYLYPGAPRTLRLAVKTSF